MGAVVSGLLAFVVLSIVSYLAYLWYKGELAQSFVNASTGGFAGIIKALPLGPGLKLFNLIPGVNIGNNIGDLWKQTGGKIFPF